MRLVSKLSYANVMSTLALFVALGGVSYAAVKLPKNSVGAKQLRTDAVTSKKVKDGSLAATDFAAGQLPAGARGPAGPQGVAGPQGAAGAAGSALAYGDFTAAGAKQGARKGLEGVTVTKQSAGLYCMSGFQTVPDNVIVSIDATTTDLGATAQATLDGLSQCPAGYQVEIQTYDSTGKPASEAFYLLFN